MTHTDLARGTSMGLGQGRVGSLVFSMLFFITHILNICLLEVNWIGYNFIFPEPEKMREHAGWSGGVNRHLWSGLNPGCLDKKESRQQSQEKESENVKRQLTEGEAGKAHTEVFKIISMENAREQWEKDATHLTCQTWKLLEVQPWSGMWAASPEYPQPCPLSWCSSTCWSSGRATLSPCWSPASSTVNICSASEPAFPLASLHSGPRLLPWTLLVYSSNVPEEASV